MASLLLFDLDVRRRNGYAVNMLSNLTIGAIGAALIAAFVSLLGLIISKEAKVSDFRQNWVDALRSEITQFLVTINAIADASQANYHDYESKLDRLGPLVQRMNEASFTIGLRLNPHERNSKDVLKAINSLKGLIKPDGSLDPKDVKPIERQLMEASGKLLKHEWKRVKRGELTFAILKWLLLISLIGGIVLLIWNDPLSETLGVSATRSLEVEQPTLDPPPKSN